MAEPTSQERVRIHLDFSKSSFDRLETLMRRTGCSSPAEVFIKALTALERELRINAQDAPDIRTH